MITTDLPCSYFQNRANLVNDTLIRGIASLNTLAYIVLLSYVEDQPYHTTLTSVHMHTFLYILVWKPGEDYADITMMSMSFLRELHPEAQILLLTDQETLIALQNTKHPVLALADRLINTEVPHVTSSTRSWYLKSRMRRLVEGDFVFLDADTIPRQRLDELFLTDAPIAMAENHSSRFPENFPDMERLVYEKNGWQTPNIGHYLNSGVIYWKDHPEAHRLSLQWELLWDASVNKGYGYDQTALNRALEISGVKFKVLDDRFNAQIRANASAGVDAALWHFYQTDRRWFPDDWFSIGLRLIRENQRITKEWISTVLEARTPYPLSSSGSSQLLIDFLRTGGTLDTATFRQLTGTKLPSTSNATVCTIITSNYLPYAIALQESVRVFEPDVHFNIFISDEDEQQFTKTTTDRHTFFHFADQVCKQETGRQIRNKYQSSDHDAFRWSCKPLFINHLIREKGYERVIYFDCDIYIFNPFRFIFDALETHNVLLTPHWRTREPDTDPEEYRFLFNHGLYNAGFIGANSHGTDVMDWWARCCLHSCARGSFEGEFVDQSILNLMPVYFEGVHILRHKGCNVAIWNRHECKRVMQDDGSVKIDDIYPVIFIHFSSGIPRSWDPVLGNYMDRYLAALRRINEDAWKREMEKRSPKRDGYLEEKSSLYLRIKKIVVGNRLSWLPPRTQGNVAIMGQSGTSQHCLGLWMRQVSGTLLSSIPVAEWSNDSVDTLDVKINMHQHLSGSIHAIEPLLASAMDGKIGDPVHINWANWNALIRPNRMVMNFPEGTLCWPDLADIIGKKHPVIALVTRPVTFAQRMMAIYGDGSQLQCMRETRNHLLSNPERPAGLREMTTAEYAWVIKWCLDIQALEASQKMGRQIIFIKDEDLMRNTGNTLAGLFKSLRWEAPDDIESHFQIYCQFHENNTSEEQLEVLHTNEEVSLALNHLLKSFGITTYATDSHERLRISKPEKIGMRQSKS